MSATQYDQYKSLNNFYRFQSWNSSDYALDDMKSRVCVQTLCLGATRIKRKNLNGQNLSNLAHHKRKPFWYHLGLERKSG
ncbi:hypothetical protein TNCV_2533561 [Trichonephila clavipes]|nr:hypothetical protein TNCV_2533561 [Trichonephila clavipes]